MVFIIGMGFGWKLEFFGWRWWEDMGKFVIFLQGKDDMDHLYESHVVS